MSTSVIDKNKSVFAIGATFDDRNLILELSDGSTVRVPLSSFPRLEEASREQRNNFRIIGSGIGISWLDLDEDLSIDGLIKDFGKIEP